jgi:hypothetical protein
LLVAALQDASTAVDVLALSEAHGTGTALGDPIEAGSLAAAVLAAREGPLAVGGVKANIGHAEPAAGMTGLLKLALGLRAGEAAPNAQLRSLNPHVGGAIRGAACALLVQLAVLGPETWYGGVSSFGYSGTIVHGVLGRLVRDTAHPPTTSLGYRRHAFRWRDPLHPFAQRRLAASESGTTIFRSLTSGVLLHHVAHHAVQARVIFPAAGHVEMVRAAATTGAALRGVFFLQPLVIEASGLLVECAVVAEGRFEVRSGEEDALSDAAMHCSGALAGGDRWQRLDHAAVKGRSCARITHAGALYDGFHAVGLQYGPGYRTLVHAWGGMSSAVARLRARSTHEGTRVHPADLDDALCLGVLVGESGDGQIQLPFAVDEARLQGALGVLWAVRAHLLAPRSPEPWSAQSDVRCARVLAGYCAADGSRSDLGAARRSRWPASSPAQRLQIADSLCDGSGSGEAALALRGRVVSCDG